MLTLDEARSLILSGVRRLPNERVPIFDAACRVLAEPVVARSALPPFDYSAMDGYAVATRDFQGPSPWKLPVLGESRAGSIGPSLSPASAMRIFTGAPVPGGADAVVAQEEVERGQDAIRVRRPPKAGEHIRTAGEDLAAGAVALGAGLRLTPGALGLAASLDQLELVVARRPRVTILCTGSELRPIGFPGRGGAIPESNGVALAAMARQAGAVPILAPIVADDAARTAEEVSEALGASDLLLTVGGVSVGDHDVVRPALQSAGVALDFWQVAIKPGKPVAFGRFGRSTYVLGLPGNPASALVTFAVFGMPLLRVMQGDQLPCPSPIQGRLGAARKRSPDRTELVRSTLRREGPLLSIFAHDNQSSGAATSLASSDGLAVVPPGEGPIEAGALVDFVRWADA